MRINLFFLFVILVCLWSTPVPAAPPENAEYQEKAESFRKAIEATTDEREQALLHKQLGDLHASWEDYAKASDEFVLALALAPSAFTVRERLRMAVSISWANRYDEAAAILRFILAEEPGNRDARVHLAKVLSWSGKLREAGVEAEGVLRDDPGNQDALLVKANVLRWQGDGAASITVYEKALQQGEQFDARLGLAYAYLDTGDRQGAENSAVMLKPQYPYQERELMKLREELKKPRPAQQVRADIKFTNYRDNEGNDVNRYAATYSFPVRAWRNQLSYVHTEARDHFRRNNADIVSGETRAQITRQLGIGAGLGVIRYRNDDTADFPVGHLKADAETPLGSVGVTLSREPFTDTAELLEKRIRVSAARAYLSRVLIGRTSFYGGYGYADYSDGNNSDDLLLSLRYDLRRENPRVNAGYRFRYLDFDRQSSGGYFDPSHFLSHQLYLNTAFEKGKIFGAAEVYVGQQSFTRNGAGRNEMFSGGAASIGYKLTKNYSVEANVEGGDYALQTATGFSYFLYGVRLSGLW
jgi:tetratricopeptide (TPR) repeat protein